MSTTITLRISAAIDNEYANRLPDFLPLDKLKAGRCILSLDEARALGGAQALWDKETAEAEAFRAAHPAP